MRATRVVLTARDGRPRLDLATGLLAPRVVRASGTVAEVALVGTSATLLGGDDVRLDVEVGPGTQLALRDVAATVAYHGRGRTARLAVDVRVREGAVLEWRAEPLVVTEGASVARSLRVEVAEGGRALMRDHVALGRTGAGPGALCCRTEVTYAGQPALVEELTVGAGLGPGVLGRARVVDSLLAVGWRPAAVRSGAVHFALEQPGALARELCDASHQSSVDRLLDRWAADLETTGALVRP